HHALAATPGPGRPQRRHRQQRRSASPPLSGSTASRESPQLEPTPPPAAAAAAPASAAAAAAEPSRAVGDGTDRELLAPPGGRLAAPPAVQHADWRLQDFSGYDLLRLAPAAPGSSSSSARRLTALTYEELFNRITSLFQADGDKISQMVAQMESESKYTLHVQPDLADPGRFRVFMRERRHHCAKGGNS
uniref:DGKH n=1 Tax=Macrostomum lignano TaxID=282301 RepID=A0A1I8FA46_9PLAT